MKGTKVASRYAKALLELAIEHKTVDSVAGDMAYLHTVAVESRDFQLLLSSPIIKADKKIAIFASIFDQFESVSKAFIELITKNGREDLLQEIAASFEAQVKEHKGIVPVTLTSATALDEATKAGILKKVEPLVSGQLEVTEKIDADLIGGFVLTMGDKQIDASVASQFKSLKQQLTK